MSPINKKSIDEKLKKSTEAIEFLEQYKKISEKDFIKDGTVRGATIHYLVLGIEIIVDIGNHILNQAFQSYAGIYEDIILELGEKKSNSR